MAETVKRFDPLKLDETLRIEEWTREQLLAALRRSMRMGYATGVAFNRLYVEVHPERPYAQASLDELGAVFSENSHQLFAAVDRGDLDAAVSLIEQDALLGAELKAR